MRKLSPEIIELRKELKEIKKKHRKEIREYTKVNKNLLEEITRLEMSKMKYVMNFYKAFLKDRMSITLNPKEMSILKLRWGFVNGKPMNLEDVAMEFGVTRERIRQLECKAIDKINYMKGEQKDEKNKWS